MPDEQQAGLLTALSADAPDSGLLSSAERAALQYADLLTRTPWRVTATTVDDLRRHGFDDRGIHDLAAIVAYFAFVNRIADGLGVELESLP